MNLRLLLPALLLALTTAFSTAAQQRPAPQKAAHTQTTQRNHANKNPNVAPIPDIPGLQKGGRPNYGGCDAYDATVGTPGCGTLSPLPPKPGEVCKEPKALNFGGPLPCQFEICDDPYSTTHGMIGDCGPCLQGFEKGPEGNCVKPPPREEPRPSTGSLKAGTTLEKYQKGNRRAGGRKTYLEYAKFSESTQLGVPGSTKGRNNRWHNEIIFSVGSMLVSTPSNSGKGINSEVLKFPDPPKMVCPEGATSHSYPGYGLWCMQDGKLVQPVPGKPDPMHTFANEHSFRWTGACSSVGITCRMDIGQNINRNYTAKLTVTNKSTGQVVLEQDVHVTGKPVPPPGGGSRPPREHNPIYIM